MKAEQRKKLDTNVLAERMSHVVETVKAKPDSRAIVIGLVILLVISAYGIWRYVASRNAASESALQMDVSATKDPERLQQLAESNRGSPASHTALFKAARLLMAEGIETLAQDPEKARKKLDQAGRLYERLAAEAKEEPLLVQEALQSAATVQRSLGNLDKAQESYQRLADLYPGTIAGDAAARDAKALRENRESLKKFYDELSQRAAPPPAPVTPELPKQ